MTTLRYLSYDSTCGEPLILSKAVKECVRRGVKFRLESHPEWVFYQRALAKDGLCTVISTHGTMEDGKFEFSRLMRDEDGKRLWHRPDRQPHVRKIAARILVVLACDGAPQHWLRKANPGTIVIAATAGSLVAGQCAKALKKFIKHLPALEASGAAFDDVWAAWPDHENFAIAQASHTPSPATVRGDSQGKVGRTHG